MCIISFVIGQECAVMCPLHWLGVYCDILYWPGRSLLQMCSLWLAPQLCVLIGCTFVVVSVNCRAECPWWRVRRHTVFMSLCGFAACLSLFCMLGALKVRRGRWIFWTGVTDGCELSYWGWGLNLSPLTEQLVFLTSEPTPARRLSFGFSIIKVLELCSFYLCFSLLEMFINRGHFLEKIVLFSPLHSSKMKWDSPIWKTMAQRRRSA